MWTKEKDGRGRTSVPRAWTGSPSSLAPLTVAVAAQSPTTMPGIDANIHARANRATNDDDQVTLTEVFRRHAREQPQ